MKITSLFHHHGKKILTTMIMMKDTEVDFKMMMEDFHEITGCCSEDKKVNNITNAITNRNTYKRTGKGEHRRSSISTVKQKKRDLRSQA